MEQWNSSVKESINKQYNWKEKIVQIVFLFLFLTEIPCELPVHHKGIE